MITEPVSRLDRWDDDAVMRRNAWTAVSVAAASIFLFVVDSGLVSLALPEIAREFPDASRATLSWVAGGFLIAQASLLLIAGRIGDRRGRRRYYLVGLGVFSLGALVTAAAPTVGLVIAGRVVQGIGAAFLTSGALALVLPMFPRRKAPVVVGAWGAVGSTAGWITPTAGALLIAVDWRLGFAVVAPIGLVTLAVGRKVLPEPAIDDAAGATDRVGLVIGPLALALLMLALSRGGGWGWSSPLTLAVAATSLALLVTFARRCSRVAAPLVMPSLLQTPKYFANTTSGFLQQTAYYSWFIMFPLVATGVWGWSVRHAGLAMAASQLPASIGAPVGGRLVVRYGHGLPTVLGAVIAAVGGLWMATTTALEPDLWRSWLPAALLLGFGASMCGTITSGAALSALDPQHLGAGNSLNQLIRRVGSAIGVALGIALLGEQSGPTALLAGSKRVWWLSATAHLIGVVPIVWVGRARLRRSGVSASRGSQRAAGARP